MAQAREAQRAAREARKALGLRTDFKDAREWERLARLRGFRLPAWGVPPTPGRMRAILRRLGVGVPDYLEWAGEETLSDFARRNPLWPLRAWAGLVLEQFAPEGGA